MTASTALPEGTSVATQDVSAHCPAATNGHVEAGGAADLESCPGRAVWSLKGET